jgi:hypothetical protein
MKKEPQILKEREISKVTQIANEPQILKEYQISEITNECEILKKP